MKDRFSIGNIEIGRDARPLVIPEIGINHEGSLKVAKEMVDAAHRAGARVTDWLGNLTVWHIERNYINDDYDVFVGTSL